MTEVSFNKYHDSYIFQCSGHTDYGKCGSDILCSAVSVLCYTLKGYLESKYAGEGLTCLSSDFRSGEVCIRFSADSECEDRILNGVHAILTGFDILSECFGEYVSFEVS